MFTKWHQQTTNSSHNSLFLYSCDIQCIQLSAFFQCIFRLGFCHFCEIIFNNIAKFYHMIIQRFCTFWLYVMFFFASSFFEVLVTWLGHMIWFFTFFASFLLLINCLINIKNYLCNSYFGDSGTQRWIQVSFWCYLCCFDQCCDFFYDLFTANLKCCGFISYMAFLHFFLFYWKINNLVLTVLY